MAIQTKEIRYFAKIDAKGGTWYFGGGWGHLGSAEALGKALRHDIQRNPNFTLVNGPESDWDKNYHSDGLGEYQLRALTDVEEKELLAALRGR